MIEERGGWFVKNVRDAASSLRLGMLPPKPSEKTCGECDFKMLCSHGCKVTTKLGGKGK